MMRCLSNVPDIDNGGFDLALSGQNEYACTGNKYIDLMTSTARCIDEGECKGVIHGTWSICINLDDRSKFPYYCYLYFDGTVMRCLRTWQCADLQKYAYA